MCPLLLLATVWGSQLQRLKAPDLPLIAQDVYMRERGKKERLTLGAGSLSSQRALAPPSPAKVGDTFVAWAFLERSCDFQDWGLKGYPRNKICLSRALLWC